MTEDNETRCTGAARRVSGWVSALLHPFLVPLYLVALMLFGPTVLAAMPLKVKLFICAATVLNAAAVPALGIGLARNSGYLSGVQTRKQGRTIPLAIVAICYGICIFMMADMTWAAIIRKMVIGAFCCALAALAITPFRRISLHMIAAGGAVGMIAMMAAAGLGDMFVPLVAAVPVAGALASARLCMGHDTLGQVGAGFAVGLVVASAAALMMK